MDKRTLLIAGGSLTALGGALITNLYVFLLQPALDRHLVSSSAVSQSLAHATGAAPTLATATPATDTSSIVAIGLMLLVVCLAAIAGLVLWMMHGQGERRRRDVHRRTDLHTIAHGFESYYAANGHYPISSTYDQHYYSVINLASDWQYYGFPNTEAMRQFIPGWPLLDPQRPLGAPSQAGQYLYFPHNSGQSFELYASLELPADGEARDYNRQDGLPLALGQYNYRLANEPHASATPVTPETAGETLPAGEHPVY